MSRFVLIIVLAAAVCVLAAGDANAAGNRFGGGLHYLRTVGDIKDAPQWDPDAIGILVSFQRRGRLLSFEGDVEWVPNYGGQDKAMIEPQAWLLLGDFIYGAGGIGIGYFDKAWQHNPFYALRLGVNIRLGSLNGDVFATYRFQSTHQLEQFGSSDLNTITFGAVVRFGK